MKTNTQQVRQILREQGFEVIYQNKYQKCRTLKVYVSAGLRSGVKTRIIKDALQAAQIDATVNYKRNRYATMWSMIVRVPLTYK